MSAREGLCYEHLTLISSSRMQWRAEDINCSRLVNLDGDVDGDVDANVGKVDVGMDELVSSPGLGVDVEVQMDVDNVVDRDVYAVDGDRMMDDVDVIVDVDGETDACSFESVGRNRRYDRQCSLGE